MNLTPLLLTLATLHTLTALSPDNQADIAYYDLSGKIHTFTLPFLINPQKIQYGVKFGIMVYYLDTANCKITVGDNMVEYFAAYVIIPVDCNPVDVVKDAIDHGADFVFANVSLLDDYSSLTSKNFEVPVLPIDKLYDDDLFKFSEVDFDRRYINLEFAIVS